MPNHRKSDVKLTYGIEMGMSRLPESVMEYIREIIRPQIGGIDCSKYSLVCLSTGKLK